MLGPWIIQYKPHPLSDIEVMELDYINGFG